MMKMQDWGEAASAFRPGNQRRSWSGFDSAGARRQAGPRRRDLSTRPLPRRLELPAAGAKAFSNGRTEVLLE